MERRGFMGMLVKAAGAIWAGTFIVGADNAQAALTLNLGRVQLPDWASPTGKSYSFADVCGSECDAQCVSMCSSQCVGAMCAKMCGLECGVSMCAAQCDIMCGGGVQMCIAQCSDMCALENGCVFMNCKSGSTAGKQFAYTALRSFEFRFNLAHLSSNYTKYRPQLIQEFYSRFTKGGNRTLAFPELEALRNH